MAKTFGYGSVIAVASSTGGEKNIACVRSISGPGVSFDDVDSTCLDSSSNFRTFVPGLGDPGEVTFEVVYDPATASANHAYLYDLMNSRTARVFSIMHGSSAGDVDTFTGYVKGLSREIPLDDLITAEFTVKVSGSPGYTS